MRLKSFGGSARTRVRATRQQTAASGDRWIRFATRGLTAIAIAVMIFATTLVAAGRLLAVSVDARTDSRSLVGMSSQSRGLNLVSLPDSGVAVPLQVAALPDDEYLSDASSAITAAHAAFPPASGTLADFTNDQLFTGSIHSFTTRFDASSRISTCRPRRLRSTTSPPRSFTCRTARRWKCIRASANTWTTRNSCI